MSSFLLFFIFQLVSLTLFCMNGRPFLVNELEPQYLLHDRRKVYEVLLWNSCVFYCTPLNSSLSSVHVHSCLTFYLYTIIVLKAVIFCMLSKCWCFSRWNCCFSVSNLVVTWCFRMKLRGSSFFQLPSNRSSYMWFPVCCWILTITLLILSWYFLRALWLCLPSWAFCQKF